MEFSDLQTKIPQQKIKQLEKKGYKKVDDVVRIKPLYYCDYSKLSSLKEAKTGERVAFHLKFTHCKIKRKNVAYVVGVCKSLDETETLFVTWFDSGAYYRVANLINKEVIIAGEYICNEYGKHITNPDVFVPYSKDALHIYPFYPKVPGMSIDYFSKVLKASIDEYDNEEYLPKEITNAFNVVSVEKMVKGLHEPVSNEEIKVAYYRRIIEKLYPFCKVMAETSKQTENTDIIPETVNKTLEIIKKLPYELTRDQKNILNQFVSKAKMGLRVNALVQGDVGSGKTICAILLMMIIVENGYQGVLMAPTGILAKQHFEEVIRLTKDMGINAVFLNGGMKTKEKKVVLEAIKSGKADIVVGTHSLISDDVTFKNLGITIIDEEHKFGVQQRNKLKEKAVMGVHNISMSATPIPRSLAQTIYSDFLDIYTIESMPEGRKPIKTATVTHPKQAFNFMKKEIGAGHQCYIVCPLIEAAEDDTPGSDKKLYSVEETYEMAKVHLRDISAKIAVVTGKMKEEEKAEIISAFQNNEYQVLIASTVIEVGVNVPNSTVITLMNAERFGLAGLHQLRGRVGRGLLQSYCILCSEDKDNPRLNIMCETTNGFKIAERDLELRGTGNIIGIEQSGSNEELDLMLRFPQIYNKMTKIIKEYI